MSNHDPSNRTSSETEWSDSIGPWYYDPSSQSNGSDSNIDDSDIYTGTYANDTFSSSFVTDLFLGLFIIGCCVGMLCYYKKKYYADCNCSQYCTNAQTAGSG